MGCFAALDGGGEVCGYLSIERSFEIVLGVNELKPVEKFLLFQPNSISNYFQTKGGRAESIRVVAPGQYQEESDLLVTRRGLRKLMFVIKLKAKPRISMRQR